MVRPTGGKARVAGHDIVAERDGLRRGGSVSTKRLGSYEPLAAGWARTWVRAHP
jgi:hypothetical protein